jgi:hypothetical protein
MARSSLIVCQIRYHVAEDANEKKTLLLRDFRLQPVLHTAVHNVLRTKFPVIDVHNHVNVGWNCQTLSWKKCIM